MKSLYITLLLLIPAYCFAQTLDFGNNVIINQPVNEDLYIAGGTVTINAPVRGDLVVTGGTVVVNDSISNDIIAAGGNIMLNGMVGDDIRCAGGKLYISQHVGGDLVVAGGAIQIPKSAIIKGSLLSSGGQITVDGTIEGYAKILAGSFSLNGTIGKTLDIKGGEIDINGTVDGPTTLAASETIRIGNNALFKSKVNYWSDKGAVNFGRSVQNGQAVLDDSLRMEQKEWKYLNFASAMALLWYLSAAFVFIVVIQYLFGKHIQKAISNPHLSVMRSIGSGALFFILIPVVIVVAFITVIGIPLAIVTLILFILLLLLTAIITSITIANWLNIRYYNNENRWRQIWMALAIFILLKIISMIPIIGWAVMLIAAFFAFGIIMAQAMKWNKPTESLSTGT